MTELARLAGAGATVSLGGLAVSSEGIEAPSVEDLDVFVDAVFREYARSFHAGAAEPAGALVDALVAHKYLFVREVPNVPGSELAAMAAEGLDLHEVIDRVRAEARRRDAVAALDVVASRVRPVGDTSCRVVVATSAGVRGNRDWVDALIRCFPSRSLDEVMLVALPDVVADLVVASARLHGQVEVAVRHCADDVEAAAVLMTAAVLLDDGLAAADALTTGAAVVA